MRSTDDGGEFVELTAYGSDDEQNVIPGPEDDDDFLEEAPKRKSRFEPQGPKKRRAIFFILGGILGLSILGAVISLGLMVASSKPEGDVVGRFEVNKSPGDPKEYRLIHLKNNLLALLISKDGAEMAGAALSVGMGSFQDPQAVPGLAHFLEHMLFMGTEKYPDEDEYSQYIMGHGGLVNAYTAGEETNYYLQIDSEYLEPALDRFSQFFIKPLLKKESINREVLAVNSEHEKNIDNDDWRAYQLLKEAANPDHPFSKFSTGNSKTLRDEPEKEGLDVHAMMKDLFDGHYFANNMRLVVYGKENLDDLEHMVVEKFVLIPDARVRKEPKRPPPFPADRLQKLYHIEPVSDRREVSIAWPLPPMRDYIVDNPIEGYISSLLGHEGEGSLLSLLKANNLATSLSAGLYADDKDFSLMVVTIQLTATGLAGYEQVISCLYDYLALLRSSGPQERIFEEIKLANQLIWKFPEERVPYSLVSGFSSWLQVTTSPNETIVEPMKTTFNGPLIQTLLNKLVAESSLVFLMAKDPSKTFDQVEKWYGTHYSVASFTLDQLSNWAGKERQGLSLPPSNPFTVTITDVITLPSEFQKSPFSFSISSNENAKFWYQYDSLFRNPKEVLHLHLISPMVYQTVENYIKSILFVQIINDMANEKVYQARIFGYSYALQPLRTGLHLEVNGFSQKLSQVSHYLLSLMVNGQIQSSVFSRVKEDVILQIKNGLYVDAWVQTMNVQRRLIYRSGWEVTEMLRALEPIDVTDLEVFAKCLMASVNVEGFFTGNLLPDAALTAAQGLLSILNPPSSVQACSAYPDQDYEVQNLVHITSLNEIDGETKERTSWVFMVNQTNPADSNSAITVLYQLGRLAPNNPESALKKACFDYISFVIRQPLFHQLRTIEGLGYIVRAFPLAFYDTSSLAIQIQSSRTPFELQSRILAFLAAYSLEFTEESYEGEIRDIIELIISQKLQKPLTLNDAAAQIWSEISNQNYVFNRKELEVDAMRTLTPEQLRSCYKDLFSSGLFTHVYGVGTSTAIPANLIRTKVVVDDFQAFFNQTLILPSEAAQP